MNRYSWAGSTSSAAMPNMPRREVMYAPRMSPVCRGAWLMLGVMRGKMWSPVSSTLRSSSKKHTWPGVWPGVCTATRLVPAPRGRSPSTRKRSGSRLNSTKLSGAAI